MSKTTLQKIADLHQIDIDNNTRFVKVSPHFVSAKTVKGGSEIAMGVEPSIVHDLMTQKSVALLLIIDKEQLYPKQK